MEALWFWLLAAMLGTYVVLGGSDLGVGIVHLLVGRSGDERWQIIRTLRPVWKPNEVWLIAASGTLFMASPTTLATAFSGFWPPYGGGPFWPNPILIGPESCSGGEAKSGTTIGEPGTGEPGILTSMPRGGLTCIDSK